MTGKSYSLAEYLCNQKRKYGDQAKNYWMRISESSTKALLANKADKLIDPDLKRKYKLDFKTSGMEVFDKNSKTKGDPFCTVVPLSKFGKLKGVGFYDKDYLGTYNIILDEFQLEIGEKRTSFDILYNFIGMCENIARTTKNKIRVFLVGNTLEEASTILKAFNFIPEKFGRFYLRRKKCIIDNLEPTEEYLKDRKGSIADILGGNSMSNYTNDLSKDRTMVAKHQCRKPTGIIKFDKDSGHWYTIWDDTTILKWNRETVTDDKIYAMRPYLGHFFSVERRKIIIERYDCKMFKFKNLISQSYFEGDLSLLRRAG